MNFISTIKTLQKLEIKENIKAKAHSEMAPYRELNVTPDQILKAKKAGVLLLIHPIKDQAYFTLIERAAYEGVHSSQIAFPGGKYEQEDLNIEKTALREAHEEVNIIPTDVKIITTLSNLYVPPSNFYITPVLGFSKVRPKYIAEQKEVQNILEIPLSELLNPNIIQETKIRMGKHGKITTPFLDLQNKIVWGATAVILNELRHHLLQTD